MTTMQITCLRFSRYIPAYNTLRFCIISEKSQIKSRFCSSAATTNDSTPLFLNPQIQTILNSLTRPDPKKVFRCRKDGFKLTAPIYKFMTDEELNVALSKANQKMKTLLQMPPVLEIKPDNKTILVEDKEIQGYDTSNYVFTDITYGLNNNERFVVVREPSGVLRNATNDERKRIIQVYFPLEGREIFPPKMFFGEYFEDLIRRQEYEFILNKATVQYDPNESEWFRITNAVYDHIDNEKAYDKLISTRFYGHMIFYFACNKNIDNLLLEYLKKKQFEDAVWLVQLYQLTHPDCKSALTEKEDDELNYIMNYIQNDAKLKDRLESAVNICKEWKRAQEKLKENIKIAHGFE